MLLTLGLLKKVQVHHFVLGLGISLQLMACIVGKSGTVVYFYLASGEGGTSIYSDLSFE